MVDIKQLTLYTNKLLQVELFHDYCPNGLQVEGKLAVSKIVSGVTACRDLIDAAVAARADAILVHHGYFWKGEDPCITGMKKQRVERLLSAGINLLAYHLPLDAHVELGNNTQLAQRLGLRMQGTFGQGGGPDIGQFGEFQEDLPAAEVTALITRQLGRSPTHIAGDERPIRRIAWCTGAAQGYFEAAISLGVDAFLTGEISEPTVHIARESGVHFFAAGHHATERYGVQALGEHLAQQFQVQHEFVDIPNPV